MKRHLLPLLLTCLVLYAALCLLVFVFQRHLIYMPARGVDAEPSIVGLPFEDVYVEAADGVRVHGWWIPAPEAKGTLLFCHGNAGNIEGRLFAARAFHEMGLSVLLFDYRGYGNSEGSPTEEGLYRDAEAMHEHLVATRGIDPDSLLLYGESLGVAVAIELAGRRPVAGLIGESGFTSMADAGARHYPWLPVRLLLRHHYENEKKIRSLSIPLLIVHSPDDEIVPFAHAQRLVAAATEPKRLLETVGGHNDGGFLQSAQGKDTVREWALQVLATGD